uniref:NFACT RNA-binding domain-containing protein n=1 Tax=Biomphalaria glabrata TaxID=6526 RepID=A0A2C9K1Q6_BIOGL
MKGRFSSIDLAVIIQEMKRFIGMRVVNVYDLDNKTYLIKLGKPDEKTVLLFESGIRLHYTDFEWPKNPAPSGFSMKLRKHLKNRRLESISQLGTDRIVDLQFGSGEAAYHVILELYDRGNVVLTDHELTILSLLRPRTDHSQDVRFAVREKYPLSSGKEHTAPTRERIMEILSSAKDGDVIKKLLLPCVDYGPAIIDHVLIKSGFSENVKFGKDFKLDQDFDKLMDALQEAENLMFSLLSNPCKGYIIQKVDKKPNPGPNEEQDILLYEEFHPYLFCQHLNKPVKEFDQFNKAVDEYFSKVESQKVEVKVIQQEKTAMKKLDHVKKEHEKRLETLQKEQETDVVKGHLIETNLELVDKAILIVRSALANQIDWSEIWNFVKEAKASGDPVASSIKSLKLDSNQITLMLRDRFDTEDEGTSHSDKKKFTNVDIDLGLGAYANAKKYFDKKRQAAKKEQKTIEASSKAFKSAEKKTKQLLKDVTIVANINKTRKTYWFEKFLWFISSENYLVIGGHDQQQNEMIVKKYMAPCDIYVHADLHGASSCVIKNPGGGPVPPKTLNEAGTMAICNSAAWESKVVTSAWWVYPHQVSKTAPSGEYLTTGSFMIRGKKNYLPPSYLIYGFGFLFKLEDGSIERHKGERKLKMANDDIEDNVDSANGEVIIDDDSVDSEDEIDMEGHDRGDVKPSSLISQTCPSADLKGDIEDRTQSLSLEDEDLLDINYPDTSIKLDHVQGDNFVLHSAASRSSSLDQSDVFFLGDNDPVILGQKTVKKGKLSAKQRRELKKEKTTEEVSTVEKVNEVDKKLDSDDGLQSKPEDSSNKKKADVVQPLKRGQKGKQKKSRRNMLTKMRRSAGTAKTEAKKSKNAKEENKKGKNVKGQPTFRPVSTLSHDSQKDLHLGENKQSQEDRTKVEFENDVVEKVDLESESIQKNVEKPVDQQPSDSDDEETEVNVTQDQLVLDSFTGIPHPEDELLYAVAVCAPYNALTNYKYKVKLLPGSTKRGKAVKNILNMFVQDKSTSSREKSLLKVLKDFDSTRNLPGKVKLAIPSVNKSKK